MKFNRSAAALALTNTTPPTVAAACDRGECCSRAFSSAGGGCLLAASDRTGAGHRRAAVSDVTSIAATHPDTARNGCPGQLCELRQTCRSRCAIDARQRVEVRRDAGYWSWRREHRARPAWLQFRRPRWSSLVVPCRGDDSGFTAFSRNGKIARVRRLQAREEHTRVAPGRERPATLHRRGGACSSGRPVRSRPTSRFRGRLGHCRC